VHAFRSGVATSLGSQLLAEHVAPPGTPPDEVLASVSDRLMLSGLDLYTFGLFTGTEYLDEYRRYSRGAAGHATPGAGEGHQR
jgi:hypothetical protein